MKGRNVLSASALTLCAVLMSGFVIADSTAPQPDCAAIDTHASDEEVLAERLSCYNSELDGLSLLIGKLLKEREQLSALLDGDTAAADIAEDGNKHLDTIERLRLERSELSAQLHRQLIASQEQLLEKEAEERLLRNYSNAYLAIADENAELVARIETLNQRIEELGQANKTLTDSNAQLTDNNQTSKATIADFSAANTQLTSTLEKKNKFTARVQTQLIETATLSEQLASTSTTLQSKLAEEQQSNAELVAQIETLSRRTEELDQTNKVLTDSNAQLTDNNQTFKATIADLSATKTKLTKELEKKNNFTARLQTQLIETAALSEQLASTTTSLQSELADEQQANKIANFNIASLNEAAEQHAASTEQQIEHYASEIQRFNKELEAAKAENAALITAAENDAAESLAAQEALSQEVASLENELITQQQTRDALNAQLEAGDQLLAEQKDSLIKLTETSESQQQQLDNAASEIADLKQQLMVATGELETARTQIKASEDELAATMQQLEQSQAMSQAVNEELDASTQNAAGLEAQIASLNEQIEKLNQQSAELQNNLDNTRTTLMQERDNRSVALAASNALLDTNSTLREQLTNARGELAQAATDREEMSKSVNELQAQNNASAAQTESLQNKIASLQHLLDQSQENNELFAKSLDSIKAELGASNERLTAQQAQLQSLVAEKESIVSALNKTQTDTRELAQEISSNLAEQGQQESVKVEIRQDHTIGLKIASNQLFRVGSSRLSADGRRLLENVAVALADTSQRRILVEGHSDNLPLGPKLARVFKDNMGLSMARALSAANFLADAEQVPAQQLSITGAGDTKPVASNDTENGRQQNRRVEILLLPLEFSDSSSTADG